MARNPLDPTQDGAPVVELRTLVISGGVLGLVPEELARAKGVLPLRLRDHVLYIATRDPNALALLDEVSFVTGRRVVAYSAARHEIDGTIHQAYAAIARGMREYRAPSAPPGSSADSPLELSGAGAPAPAQQAPQPRQPSHPPMPARQPTPVREFEDGPPAISIGLDAPTPAPAQPRAPAPPQVRDPSQPMRAQPAQAPVRDPSPPMRAQPPQAHGEAPGDPDDLLRKGESGLFQAHYATAVVPQPGTRPRVLVVDDEPAIRKILRHALTQRGYEILEAGTGMDALRVVKEAEPDAILLDAMLPDVHGFEIARRLKESRRYAGIPIVMMTAVYKGWRIAADLRDSYGVVQVIEKPFDMHAVAGILENAVSGKRATPQDPTALSKEAKREYTEASAAYKRGDLENAIISMRRAATADPLSPHLRLQLGLLLAMRGEDFQAITELELAIELDPESFQALRNLASLYQRKGFRRQATELFERALNCAPDDNARSELRQVLMKLLQPVVKTTPGGG
ncbi:MAG: response regulator [Deltaproteobacteria bacterium]|nr:response regulator [Deltaproteobacteria bacterium]